MTEATWWGVNIVAFVLTYLAGERLLDWWL